MLPILAENLFFFCSFGAGLGGDERGSNYHSDKGQSDEQIVHSGISLGGF
jgi:hypothetical protein